MAWLPNLESILKVISLRQVTAKPNLKKPIIRSIIIPATVCLLIYSFIYLFWDGVLPCHTGWGTVKQSWFTTASASLVQMILLPKSRWGFTRLDRLVSNSWPQVIHLPRQPKVLWLQMWDTAPAAGYFVSHSFQFPCILFQSVCLEVEPEPLGWPDWHTEEGITPPLPFSKPQTSVTAAQDPKLSRRLFSQLLIHILLPVV